MELRARRYLESRGLVLQTQNYRCRFGEIDLIMQDRGTLVFVEVRFRTPGEFASSLESVDAVKQQKIIRTAASYLVLHPRLSDWPVRFDVVGIADGNADNGKLQWVRDAFRA